MGEEPASKGSDSSMGIRWLPGWHVLFFAILVGIAAVAAVDTRASVDRQAATTGLSLALAAWYGIALVHDRRQSARWALPGLVYLGVGWAIWLALVALVPLYLFLLGVLYPQVSLRLQLPWSIAGLVVLTILWAGELAITQHALLGPFVLAMEAGAISILMTMYVRAMVHQSTQRGRLLAELVATRNELAAAERLAGTIEERQRLAGEIHDTIAQALAGTVFHLESARQSLPAESKEAERQIDMALRGARDSLSEARSLTLSLQPAALSADSLGATLTDLAERWSLEHGVAVDLRITGTAVAVPPETAVTLLRTAQESLANVGKHAGARTVTLTLSYMDELVVLDVQDDGQGFEPDASTTGASPARDGTGFGLAGLRQRAERQGGSLTIESTIGQGSTIAVSIPVRAT